MNDLKSGIISHGTSSGGHAQGSFCDHIAKILRNFFCMRNCLNWIFILHPDLSALLKSIRASKLESDRFQKSKRRMRTVGLCVSQSVCSLLRRHPNVSSCLSFEAREFNFYLCSVHRDRNLATFAQLVLFSIISYRGSVALILVSS